MKSSKKFHFKTKTKLKSAKLLEVYKTLRKSFGHQDWWPGETPFEVIVGAILTQNTSWTNVEKAIWNLKKSNKLTPEAMLETENSVLAELIRPAGYFNVKTERLKSFLQFLFNEYDGKLSLMFREPGETLRKKLLGVKGIGPETCDSILLYAAEKPFFVIDAYTKRIFSRHGLISSGKKYLSSSTLKSKTIPFSEYETWQKMFRDSLPNDVRLYNDFHAQIVQVGKEFCRPQKVFCESCPLKLYL